MMSEGISNVADAPVLREWSYPFTQSGQVGPVGPTEISEQVSPPVAPAEVLPFWLDQTSATEMAIPVASFVTNLVRSGIDQISAYASPVIEPHDGTHDISRDTMGQAVASLQRTFEDAVVLGNDLIAVPLTQCQQESGRSGNNNKNKKGRNPLRSLRKWVTRRATKFMNESSSTEEQTGNPHNKTKEKRRKRRRNRASRSPQGRHRGGFLRTGQHPPSLSTVSANYLDEEAFITSVASADVIIESTGLSGLTKEKNKDEEISLNSMLDLARLESADTDDQLDQRQVVSPRKLAGISLSDPRPLTEANEADTNVVNNTLKIVVVGNIPEKRAFCRRLAGKDPKRPRLSFGVDVHTYTEKSKQFSIWDVSSAGAGSHIATQSLFFSNDSLSILLWDLGQSNLSTFVSLVCENGSKACPSRGYESEDDISTDFQLEEARRKADRALELDIRNRVLSFVEAIAKPGCAIMPIITVPIGMNKNEIRRRCSMFQILLMQHPAFEGGKASRLIFRDDSILQVEVECGLGFSEVRESVYKVSTNRYCGYVGTRVPNYVVQVLGIIRRLRANHKIILLDHLMSEMHTVLGFSLPVEQVQASLCYLSSLGEVLYYGETNDDILSRYIILCRRWLVSALSCILRPDLQREIDEARRFVNLQSMYSGENCVESNIVHRLLQGSCSSCPILSARDSAMLWKSMSFIREAVDRTARLSEASDSVYEFLERLLVHSGVFMSLDTSEERNYFVPSLLDNAEPCSVWTYKTSNSWLTSLCHSWLFVESTPQRVMEVVTVSLLRNLYEFCGTAPQENSKSTYHSTRFSRVLTGRNNEEPDHEKIEFTRIHQIMSWKSSMLIKIGTVFRDTETSQLRETFCEIYVALVQEESFHCCASKDMTFGATRLVVCGKGQNGFNGRKLWQGGFGLVVDTIEEVLSNVDGTSRQVICPECLAHSNPRTAHGWKWERVHDATLSGNGGVRCRKGHLVDCNLLCGTIPPPDSYAAIPQSLRDSPARRPSKKVASLLPSTVIIGLWDAVTRSICKVGSGFVVDRKYGLIVTASHVLFDMADEENHGAPYFEPDARIMVGVIPDGGHEAVFRYFATIASHDVRTVDACVLRVTERIQNDWFGVNRDPDPLAFFTGSRLEYPAPLLLCHEFELEESVRILGFNQGGEGLLEAGSHINMSGDFAKGYICGVFKKTSVEEFPGDSTCEAFNPREEIVVMCPTICGHSGGPCVNDEGMVIGILSRANALDRQRCYVVPAKEIHKLVVRAIEDESLQNIHNH
eukprot:CAMPEP_0202478980 /NCGR_PEP_ID=MMETSP1360-20130828/94746_1 /ASSEMBLY_ACC=CAM_ASM_000848 /TAXON_ID=515479 /ORGANISM="Licmophora paradoxa, Strain CCMP2313" /LENGTH=1267 /DNA_ID=CAMNT_0049106287 /DNA_START=488 /DNA_END=4291 /DNA_ORIENTATION=+